jgi:hypothetical protein
LSWQHAKYAPARISFLVGQIKAISKENNDGIIQEGGHTTSTWGIFDVCSVHLHFFHTNFLALIAGIYNQWDSSITRGVKTADFNQRDSSTRRVQSNFILLEA